MEILHSTGINPESSFLASVDQPEMQQVSQEAKPQKSEIEQLVDALAEVEDAPDIYQLEQWKSQYGNFQVSSIVGDSKLYIWRTLKRNEYKQIAQSGAMKDELLYQEAVIRKTLLWPQPKQEWIVSTDAGTLPTLFNQIMHYSGFVPDQMALALVNVL